MWIAIFIVGIVLTVVHAVYVARRVTRAIEEWVPRATRLLPWARRLFIAVGCSGPALVLVWLVYVLIARPDDYSPNNRLVDYAIVLPFWFVTVLSFQWTLLVGPVDVAHWIARKLGALHSPRWTRWRHLFCIVVVAFFSVYMPVRMVLDTTRLETRHFVLRSDNLPPELDGFKVALLTDPQADAFTGEARLAEFVATANAESPDLVLIAGDIITRAPQFIDVAADALAKLRAPHGVLSTIGDHDNFAYRDRDRSVREVKAGLAKRGIAMPDNEVRVIAANGRTIGVIIATNNYISRIGPGAARKLISRAAGTDVQLLLAHQSSEALISAAVTGGVDAFLTGHTHGGQVRFWLPFFDLALVRFETPYVSGRYDIRGMPLFVSNGLGMSVAPFRYRAPATVDIITLRATSPVAAR